MEIFRKYNEAIEVSNRGRVKKNGKVIKPSEGKLYYYITYKGKVIRVHQMVGQLFPEICGDMIEKGHLHHINGNSKDNRAENLVWICPEDHKKLHQEEQGISIPVKAYDLEGNYVGRWDSINQAVEATKADNWHIKNILGKKEKRLTSGGLYWFREDEDNSIVSEVLDKILERQKKKELIEEQRKRRIEELKIVEHEEDGSISHIWNNVQEIAEHYKITASTIYYNLRGKTTFVKKGGIRKYFTYKDLTI